MNGYYSTWNSINAGVPHCSILEPLLFLLFINDIVDVVSNSMKLFADDTSLQNIKTRASFLINFIYMIFPGAIRTKMYTKMFMLQISTSSRTQYESATIVTGLRKGTSRVKWYGELGWDSLQNRRKKQKLIIMFKALEGVLPNYITNNIISYINI
jgi:hypothetical protein